MKFIHISDLHFGKALHGISLLEDQRYWVDRFLELCEREKPDAVLVAGDVYDRSNPAGEAVTLCDRFVTGIAAMDIPLLITAGNHDSGVRLAFASDLLKKSRVHLAGELKHGPDCVSFTDAHGTVKVWLLPFVFPAGAAQALGIDSRSIHGYEDAVRRMLDAADIDASERNIIVAHQNVTLNGEQQAVGGSETAVSSIGGVDGVDSSVFDAFDYAALGHIHAAYSVGRDTVRYCGSPLNYHFDEAKRPGKGPVIVTLGAKGTQPEIRVAQLEPLHRLIELRGTEAELRARARDNSLRDAYFRVVVTDCRLNAELSERLTADLEAHPNCKRLQITSEYAEMSDYGDLTAAEAHNVSDAVLFARFYRDSRGGADPTESDERLFAEIEDICRTRYGEGKEPSDAAADALIAFICGQEDA